MKKPLLSVIVPVYNEEDNIKLLIQKISEVLSKIGNNWEIILVNDGSKDKSEKILEKVAKTSPFIKIINFPRNFGQTAAFSAGIDLSQGDILITLDADLQNDPEDIPKMMELLKTEHPDIIVGWRKNRKDPFLRSILSKIANKIIRLLTNTSIHDMGCSLRIYKREAIKNIKLYGEMHRFIPALAKANGAKLIEMEVSHYPRQFGQSKYGLTRTFKVMLDLITVKFLSSFQTKPIYMFGTAGFIFILLGFIMAFLVIIRKIFFGGEWVSPLFFVTFSFINFGVMSVLLGLIAEIQIRSWYEGSGKKAYTIKNTYNFHAV